TAHVHPFPTRRSSDLVGHMNIGAGRIAVPDLGRIDNAVADGSLKDNPAVTGLIARLKHSGGALHLMGLLSDGGVHSHQDHMAARSEEHTSELQSRENL